MKKVLGRRDYRVLYLLNRIKQAPFKELVVIKDFSSAVYRKKL